MKRARYVLHICSIAGMDREEQTLFPVIDLAMVRLLDEALDLFDNEPRFQHLTLDGQTLPLEEYLAIRSENFERIESVVHDGQLLIGPWYVLPRDGIFETEALIRNLMIGLRTAQVFGRPMLVGYLPHLTDLPPQLPQIFKSFGINTAILGYAGEKPLVETAKGIDGTTILVSYAATLPQDSMTDVLDQIITIRSELAPYSESGHILFLQKWQSDQILRVIPEVQRTLHDDAFHSHPVAYAKAIDVSRDSAATPSSSQFMESNTKGNDNLRNLLDLETFAVLADALPVLPGEQHLRNPRRAIQKLWKDYLRFGKMTPELERGITTLLQPILADISKHKNTPHSRSDIIKSDSPFHITAIKLPDDGDGLIVRGENITDNEEWVTLTPWRAYPVVEVVTMDEVPTGGQLAPESNGAIRFKAGPHHILTFWFHD